MPTSSSRSGATLAGAFAIALWSFSGLCYAVGTRTLGPMPFLAVSSMLGVLTIVAYHLIRRRPVLGLFRVQRRVLLAGIPGIVVYSLLLSSAMGMAPEPDAAQVMLLNYLWPIWIVLFGILLLEEKTKITLAMTGALLGLAGVVLARGNKIFTAPAASLLPHAMAGAGGALWALYSVLLRRWKIPVEEGGSSCLFLILSLVSGAIATVQKGWKPIDSMDRFGLLLTLFVGIGPVGMAYYAWEIGMKRGAVHVLAVLSYFIPIASVLLIGLFVPSNLSPLLLAGAAMIATGAWIGKQAGA